MKFDAIFYALEVADAGSFSQAARNLYLSQPNLSYAVRQLEKDRDPEAWFPLRMARSSSSASASSGGNMSRFKASLSCHTGISGSSFGSDPYVPAARPGLFPGL